jgi:putative transposase
LHQVKTYRFRIYPNGEQEARLNNTLQTCRRFYNTSLSQRSNIYGIGYYEQNELTKQIRQNDKDLKQVHSQVLQQVLLRLDKAYQAFFKRLTKYPKFKRKHHYNSFTYPQSGFKLNTQNNRIKLFSIGNVKIKLHRDIIGEIKRCSVIRDIDQWYVCFSCDNYDNIITNNNKVIIKTKEPIGIDLGLISTITLSNGEKVENPRILNKSIEKIKKLQRILSRKQKGSHNRQKARIQLARLWRKVRRQRLDFVHKLSTDLVRKYKPIIFEKLTINNMVKNHRLAASILNATWGKLYEMTAYKVERYGIDCFKIPPRDTTQRCSRCGLKSEASKDLKDRIHKCLSCGLVMDRDHNAAINVLTLGLEQSNAENLPLLVQPKRKRISKFGTMKQEAHELIRG